MDLCLRTVSLLPQIFVYPRVALEYRSCLNSAWIYRNSINLHWNCFNRLKFIQAQCKVSMMNGERIVCIYLNSKIREREICICIYLNLLKKKNVFLVSDKIMWNMKLEKFCDLRYEKRHCRAIYEKVQAHVVIKIQNIKKIFPLFRSTLVL